MTKLPDPVPARRSTFFGFSDDPAYPFELDTPEDATPTLSTDSDGLTALNEFLDEDARDE
jgi:hypothetical protein